MFFDNNNLHDILHRSGGAYLTPYKQIHQSDLIRMIEKINKHSKRKYGIIKDFDEKKVALVVMFEGANGVLPLTRHINYQYMESILTGIEKYIKCEESNGELSAMLNIPELQ